MDPEMHLPKEELPNVILETEDGEILENENAQIQAEQQAEEDENIQLDPEYVEVLHNEWRVDQDLALEKKMVELHEIMAQASAADKRKLKQDLVNYFNLDLNVLKTEVEERSREQWAYEIGEVQRLHEKEIKRAKRRQWCSTCLNESCYHCCWNTSYCSKDCQRIDWTQHKLICRRKKAAPAAPKQEESGSKRRDEDGAGEMEKHETGTA